MECSRAKILFLVFFVGINTPFISFAQQTRQPKYSLFRPVPKAQMREMETDRPGATETPITVDAGHFQYETDLVQRMFEKGESTKTNSWFINQAAIKVGLTNSTALQLNFESYTRQIEEDLVSGKKTVKSGFGDLKLRMKQNLIGNDGGNFALALLPYVKFPTSQYDSESRFEGGLLVPMQQKLGDWNLGLQVQVDRLKDDEGSARHTEFLQALSLSHPILKNLDGMTETYYTYNFKAHEWSNFVDAALQMEVKKDFKLDAGITYGIQRRASKQFFIGASFRI